MQIEHPGKPGVMLDVVVLDYETFYSVEFGLGSLSTPEYVRDERFHVHGAALLSEATGPSGNWIRKELLPAQLAQIDWSRTALLAHNTAFDGFILAEHYNVRPAFYLDTLAMARGSVGHHVRHGLDYVGPLLGLGGKVGKDSLSNTKGKVELTDAEHKALGEYAKIDAIRCLEIFNKLYPHIPDNELRLIDITIRMFTDPVFELDIELVQEELDEEVGNKIGAIMRAGVTAEELMSNQKFEELLVNAGLPRNEIPRKLSPRTNQLIPAFAASDDGFKDLLEHPTEKIRLIANARRLVKSTIGETRAARFLELGKDGRKVPVHLNYGKAHTFRWSGGDKTNMQNLRRGGRLRRALRAPAGKHVVVADSGQIEARVTAWLAGDRDLLSQFAALTPTATSDVYTEFATLIFGRQVIKITDANKKDFSEDELKWHKMARHVGKTCILGLGYSMGPKKLDASLRQQGLKLGLDFCRKAVDTYRARNWRIKQFWQECDELLAHMAAGGSGTFRGMPYGRDWIKLPSGLFLRYPDLRATEVERWDGRVDTEYSYKTLAGRNKIYGGSMTENFAQALARCIIAEQMLEIEDDLFIERIATMTHDEVVAISTATDAPAALAAMIEIMSTSPAWCPDLPLAAEGGHAPEYSK